MSIDPNKQDTAPGAPLKKTGNRQRRNLTVALISLLLLGVCAWGVLAPQDKGGWVRILWAEDAELDVSKWHEVKRGPLTISLNRSGTIHHRDKIVIKSKLEGYSTVIWLIEEGSQVKKGDLLLEMDPTDFVQKKEAQDIVVIRSEALVVSETENLEVVKNAAQTDIDDAKLAIMLAELDLKKYLGGGLKEYSTQTPPGPDDEGEYPKLYHQAQGAIKIAEEELKRAQDRVIWSTKLEKDGYLTRTELQADILAKKKAELGVSSAKSDLVVLEKYTYARKLAELKNGLLKAKNALKPAQRKAMASIRQAEAEVAAAKSEHKRHLDLQKKYADQIKECKIYAPGDGQVVYATTTSRRRHERAEELQKGSSIRERQELFHMPNADHKVMAVVNIPQACEPMLIDAANGGRLKRLPARVKIAGAKDKHFPATLAKIAPLPHNDWIKSIKVFTSEVHVNDVCPELRPGYTCSVEIIIKQYDDVLSVPLQSVQLIQGKPTVYVRTPSGPQRRVVRIGMDNNRFVHIKDGLKAGDLVLLAPPFESSAGKSTGANKGSDKGKGKPAGRPTSRPSGRRRRPANTTGHGKPRRGGPPKR